MKLFKKLIALGSALLLGACGNNMLDSVQGHWVDINSDTTLDFKGNKMTLTFGSFTEKYTVKAEKEYNEIVIHNAKNKGLDFGLMSALTLTSDGKLRAYEQILDAAGHTYVFVREEDLAKELAVQDLSEDLPKEITSDQLEHFSLSFANKPSYGLDGWSADAHYSWQVERQEDGTYYCDFDESFDSYMGVRYSDEVDQEFVDGLVKLLKGDGILPHNGYHMKNNADKGSYSLYVDFVGGEEIRIRASGDPSDTMVFDLQALMDYAKALVTAEE